MSQHNFEDLKVHYPRIIDTMDTVFSSHQFILALAQHAQKAYVEALHTYRDTQEPFKIVHQQLSALLEKYPDLVQSDGRDEDSRDIFGNRNSCSRWRRLVPD